MGAAGDESEAGEESDDFLPALNESLKYGKGLLDRLHLLMSARDAGNTSLDIANEISDTLKRLLMTGKISKTQYKTLSVM